MKTERQLGIITYLLNRDIVTCKELAERFEVTERTIQRDIDGINMAGIPVLSIRGTHGGYKILDTYRLSKQTAMDSDIQTMGMALETMNSVMDHKGIRDTLEKVKSLQSNVTRRSISVDFSAAKENKKVVDHLKLLEEAIHKKVQVVCHYVSASGRESKRTLEPVTLNYRWYGWYLVAYCMEKRDYRIFKLVRMSSLLVTEQKWSRVHEQAEDLFERLMDGDTRRLTKVTFRCNYQTLPGVDEYLGPVRILEKKEGSVLGEFTVVEDERMWFGLLLSFGDQLEVVSPESVRRRVYKHSQKIYHQYKIPDR